VWPVGGKGQIAYIHTTFRMFLAWKTCRQLWFKVSDNSRLDETKYKVKNLLLKTLKADFS
jgi:hypothetical protein